MKLITCELHLTHWSAYKEILHDPRWKGARFTMSNLMQWGENINPWAKRQKKMSDKLNLRKNEGNDKELCVINP
jgi:hypothetical protein